MMRRVIALAVFVAFAAVPLRAELKYTVRMEVKKTATAPAAPVDPSVAAVGSMVIEMMLPGGSIELTVLSGERGTRIEANKPLAGLPAGAVVLQRPDGSVVGFDPASKTFWKSPAPETGGIQAKTRRTGDYSTVNGERVERVSFQITLPLGEALKTAPPLTIEGDAWVAERFKQYTTAKSSRALGALSLFQLADLGLSMRQVMRSPMFGAQEIESTVTKVAEEAAPASAFDVPAGFKEVSGPGKTGKIGD